MTKIKNYPLDLEVNGGDKWIGTDSASLAKLTKNFTPDNLAKYYNDKEVVESVNQLRFFYDTVDPGDDRAKGSFSFPTEVGPIVPFSSIDSLVFSKYTMGNDAVNNFMTDIVNSIIIIQKADNPNIYAFYALNSYEVDPLDGDFYNVSITYSSGTGSIEEDEDYLVSLIQFAGAAGIQTILGSDFIDSSLTGIGEVTISLSATGTPSNLTGLRGDNTWGTLGLEALDEGGRNSYLSTDAPIGYRIVGRDPSLYGNIGEDAIDFSTGYFQDETLPFGGSITNSPQIGSVGPGSFTLGNTVENNSSGGVVFGSANVLNGGPNIEPTYFVGGVVLGQYNQSYGLNYYNFTSGYKNLIGDRTQQSWSDAGFPTSWPVQYWSGQIGMYNQMPSGYASVQLGYGLLSGGPFCTTVGVSNEDVTLTIAKNIVNDRNALNPRFIVGCGTFAGSTQNPSVGVRQNGFVVMSDGTATFPVLTNAMIDAAGADSAVTKGWIQALPSTDTTYDLASAQNGTDVDITLTGSDATVDTVKLVAGANIILTDSGTSEITIDAIGAALSAEQVRIEVKNTSGVTLTKGTPVYITGTVGATVRAEVAAADASDPTKMPSVGVLAQDLINNADGYAVTGGFLTNITTDPIDGLTPTENDTVYVKAGGGLTLTKPTSSDLIQNIAKVGKVSGGNAGSLVISSILRTNDVPNLTTGKIWVGTAANTAESAVVHLDEGNGRMGIGTTSPSEKLHIAGSSVLLESPSYADSGFTVSDDIYDYRIGTIPPAINTNYIHIQRQSSNTIFKQSSGAFLWQTAGSEYMRITSTGKVGIGTSGPASILDLNIPLASSDGITLDTNNEVYSIWSNSNLNGLAINANAVGDTSRYDLFLKASNGYVGIGKNSPVSRLEVQGGTTLSAIGFSGPTVKIGDYTGIGSTRIFSDGSYIGYSTANSYHDFSNSGASQMRITSTGNVGIGTTSPSYKLELGSGDFSLPLGSVIRFGPQLGVTKANLGKLSIYGGTGATTAGGVDLYRWNGAAYSTALRLSNTGQVQLDEYGSGTFTGTATQRLAVDSSGNVIEIPIGSGPVDGSGTANYTARWTDADTIGIGSLYDDGTGVGIGTTTIYSNSLNLNNAGSLRIGNAEFISKDVNDLSIFQNKIRVTSTGNVGIGTTSPAYALDVVGSLNNVARITSTTSTSQILLVNSGTTDAIALSSTNDDFAIRVDNGNIDLKTNSGASALTRMRITNTGNVGIGTTSPATKLEVAGVTTVRKSGIATPHADTDLLVTDATASLSTAQIQILGGNAGSSNLKFSDTDAYSSGSIDYLHSADSMSFRTNSTIQATINSSGNVGIGTTSPAARIQVDSTENVAAIINSTNAFTFLDLENDGINRVQIGNASDGDFIIRTADTERLRVDSTGNVGINTSAPGHKLHVQGNNGTLLVTREITTPNQARVGIGTNNPSYAIDLGAYSDRIVGNVTSLRFVNGSRISELNSTRLVSQANGGFFFYPTTATPSADAYGVNIRHLRDSAVNTTDAVLSINNSVGSNLMLVRSDGRVGIGTTSPASKLHVQGDTYIQNGNLLMSSGVYGIANVANIAQKAGFPSSGNFAFQSVDVGIGTTTPAAKLDVNGGIRMADDASAASATNVGTLRYRTSGNNSYVDMCMQTGAATYAWVNIVQNNW